jgi:hypothetical protein
MTDTTKLEEQIAALTAEVEKLKAKDAPRKPFVSDHVPFDPTANATMPRSALQAMVSVVGDDVMRDIVRSAPPATLAPLGPVERPAVRGSGWRNPAPLDVPGGARSQQLIADGVNAALPHGPANPVRKKE